MRNIELLAPAGSRESLQAAVLSGTDAVYFGGSKFSARAYASNFDNDSLKEALDYCHLYGVKVYITLNTLIKDREISEAVEYIRFLYEIGVDALIIQDTGIACIMKNYFPDFEIHASTQMTIHNAEGAFLLIEEGFKRIVLSRELSLNEIRHISVEKKIETEIFVHGALCICYSGQCLMSSLIGGRSGNRGRCAQPCRLPYRLINKRNNEETQGYLMSPKDICTLENLEDIVEAGTSSLKIEGRMKRPEYVAGVVGSYRKALDAIAGNSESIDLDSEKKRLLKLFNREGFSKAYMYGNTGKDMMAYSYPKNTGIKLGEVLKDLSVVLLDDLSVGDGIRCGEEGFTVSRINFGGAEVKEASSGERVKIYPSNFRSGDELFKTSDIRLNEELSSIYVNQYGKKLGLNLEVHFKVDNPLRIKTTYNGRHYEVSGDVVQEAVNKPLDLKRIEESLRKTGDSIFKIDEVHFTDFEEGFLPISSINAVRRELIEAIERAEKEKYRREHKAVGFDGSQMEANTKSVQNKTVQTDEGRNESLVVTVCSKEQLKAAEESGIKNIVIDIFKRDAEISINDVNCENVYIKIPNIIKEEYDEICRLIEDNLSRISGIVTGNLGIIKRFAGRIPIIGDYKLNIFNSFSARFFQKYINVIPLSVELNKKEISEFTRFYFGAASGNRMVQALIYGKIEVMISEYCPVGSVMGGKDCKSGCKGVCSKGNFVLKDRKGEEFLLQHDKFCRSYVYNSVPTNLIESIDELKKMEVESFRIDFTDENYEVARKVLKAVLGREDTLREGSYTKGHYKRGVE